MPQLTNPVVAKSTTRDTKTKTVCVVGLGYIGLPTAAVLANRGHQVHGVDVYQHIVDTINRGEIHIHEPNLDQLVKSVVEDGQFQASLEPCEADVFMICVPTPITENKAPDVSYVRKAAQAIRPFVREGNLIILESTSPPGTTNTVVAGEAIPDDLEIGRDVFVAYCPERVLPGRILIEAVENDRVVGGFTDKCAEVAKAFYETFVTGRVWPTDTVTGEMVKLVENAYRDVNIAFANELSILADRLEADPFEIIELANKHPRVNILTPGPGVGGHCISVDPWFLIHGAPDVTPLMKQARLVNHRKPEFVVETVQKLVEENDAKTIGCLGLTYKADVDDMRESPSLEIALALYESNVAEVVACDPYLSPESFDKIPLVDLDEVLERCDVLVLLTDHTEFKTIDAAKLRQKSLVDTRGTWRETIRKAA